MQHAPNHVVQDAAMFKVHQLDICVKTNFYFEQTTIIQLQAKRQTNQLNNRKKYTLTSKGRSDDFGQFQHLTKQQKYREAKRKQKHG